MRPLAAVSSLLALAFALAAGPARGDIALIAADESGVTLRVTAPAGELRPAGEGRFDLVVPDREAFDVPGRPRLPSYETLIALPPGARASARVIAADPEEVRETRLAPAARPDFRRPPGEEEWVPVREPVPMIADGPWPAAPVELGEPFALRRQRLVAVTVRPWRYDESSGRLWSHRSMTVRVDFAGGDLSGAVAGGEADRHWDPVLREGVINRASAGAWRAPRPVPARPGARPGSIFQGPAGAGVETEPEVRVRIDSTGVWALDCDELLLKGFPANTPIGQVSVHRHEFVENQSPPYVTIELPIEVVNANGNAVFDSGDYIVVWVQAWAERSRASYAQRAWGDAEVIYATRVAGAGLRIAERPGWRGTPGLTLLSSYPFTQKWEHTYHYSKFPADTLHEIYFWTAINRYVHPDSFQVETNHIDPSRPIDFTLAMQAFDLGNHFLLAELRNGAGSTSTIADWYYWTNDDSVIASARLPATALSEGDVNRLQIRGKNHFGAATSASFDVSGLDWYQATYWRRYRAIAGYLSCNSGDASGEYQIRATNFSSGDGSDLRVYDVTDSLAPVKLTLDASHLFLSGPSEYDIEFQDTTPGARRSYVVCSIPKFPPSDRFERVNRLPVGLTARTAGDYLLVVPEEFLPDVQPLVNLREAQGLRVVVAPLQILQDEFNGGRKSSYAIKRFVRHAFDNWDARFLMLVGDANEDPQNLLQWSSRDWVPTQVISGPVQIGGEREIMTSDPWYVCLEGACNLYDFQPDLQSLFMGRLPVRSPQEARDAVAKLVDYENFAADQAWRNNLLLSSDDEFSTGTFGTFGGPGYCRSTGEFVFRLINERIMRMVADTAGFRQTVVDTFHLDWWLRNERLIPNTSCRLDLSQTISNTRGNVTGFLFSRLNAGRLWWNFQGHANRAVLTHENLYQNLPGSDDRDRLLNDRMPFLFSAFSCHANEFATPRDFVESLDASGLGEEMVRMPLRGAIASWASTGYEILPEPSGNHINLEWARAMFLNPPHDEFLGERGARVVLGETIALALKNYVSRPQVQGNINEKGIALTYHLLGDPATRLSIGPPQSAVVANGLPVVDDQPVRLHTLGDTLRIEADLVSNTAIDTIFVERSDAAGTVVIPPSDYTLTPAFPDTAAAGLGGRRYQLTLRTTLTPTSHRFTIHTTDRYGVTGSFDVVFQFLTQLRLGDVVLAEDDIVPPTGDLSIKVLSPSPLVPATDLTLTINGVAQTFTATPAPGDASDREWILSWTHPPYPIDRYEARLAVAGGATYVHHFRVEVGGGELRLDQLVAFPNPFQEERGTRFSFNLISGAPADLLIRVYTASGRLVYERVERGLQPGYHQLPWNGVDAEGSHLANGTYLYRMLATNGSGKTEITGRLVKLRRPRGSTDTP